MHFKKKGCTNVDLALFINNCRLDVVPRYKYLGITLGSSLEMETIMEPLVNAGNQALSQIIGKTHNNYDLSYQTFSTLYKAGVMPILDYASGAWNLGLKNSKIDQNQDRAMQFYLGLPKTSPRLALVGDMGWIPGPVRRDLDTVHLYNQITQMSETRITQQVFEMECENRGAWYNNLHNICNITNRLDNLNRNMPIAIKDLEQELSNMYTIAWKNEMGNSVKLENYGQIKSELKPESYVKCNLPKVKHSLIARIHSGMLPLQIESGKHIGIERSDRLCTKCDQNVVEDEVHFLFHCNAYDAKRLELYRKVPYLLNANDNIVRFGQLCNLPFTFATYLMNIWEK